MRATAIATLLFAIVLTCAAAGAGEAFGQNNSPITQAELDAYITMLSKIDSVGNDENAIFQLYRSSGLSPDRFQLIGGRIMAAYMLANGATIDMLRGQGLPPELEPSAAEVDLINKNMTAIVGAMSGGHLFRFRLCKLCFIYRNTNEPTDIS